MIMCKFLSFVGRTLGFYCSSHLCSRFFIYSESVFIINNRELGGFHYRIQLIKDNLIELWGWDLFQEYCMSLYEFRLIWVPVTDRTCIDSASWIVISIKVTNSSVSWIRFFSPLQTQKILNIYFNKAKIYTMILVKKTN